MYSTVIFPLCVCEFTRQVPLGISVSYSWSVYTSAVEERLA